jgi:hypothetical protein
MYVSSESTFDHVKLGQAQANHRTVGVPKKEGRGVNTYVRRHFWLELCSAHSRRLGVTTHHPTSAGLTVAPSGTMLLSNDSDAAPQPQHASELANGLEGAMRARARAQQVMNERRRVPHKKKIRTCLCAELEAWAEV